MCLKMNLHDKEDGTKNLANREGYLSFQTQHQIHTRLITLNQLQKIVTGLKNKSCAESIIKT